MYIKLRELNTQGYKGNREFNCFKYQFSKSVKGFDFIITWVDIVYAIQGNVVPILAKANHFFMISNSKYGTASSNFILWHTVIKKTYVST